MPDLSPSETPAPAAAGRLKASGRLLKIQGQSYYQQARNAGAGFWGELAALYRHSGEEKEKIRIWDYGFQFGLHLVGALAMFWPQCVALYNRWRAEKNFDQAVHEKIRTSPYTILFASHDELPSSHPLRQRIAELAAPTGAKIDYVFVAARGKEFSCESFYTPKGRMALYLGCDPLSLPEGDKILKSAVAHEIAGALEKPQSNFFEAWGSNFVVQAGMMHPFVIFSALLAAGLAWPLVVLGTAAVILPGAMAMRLLHRAYKRNHDILVDLRAAEMTDDPQTALVLLDRESKRKSAPYVFASRIRELFSLQASLSDRMEALKKCFNLQSAEARKNTTAPAKEPSSPPPPPAPV
jgi:hypothetical protein